MTIPCVWARPEVHWEQGTTVKRAGSTPISPSTPPGPRAPTPGPHAHSMQRQPSMSSGVGFQGGLAGELVPVRYLNREAGEGGESGKPHLPGVGPGAEGATHVLCGGDPVVGQGLFMGVGGTASA